MFRPLCIIEFEIAFFKKSLRELELPLNQRRSYPSRRAGQLPQLTPEQVVNSYQLKHKTAHGLVVRGAYPEEQVASSNPFRDCFLHYFFPYFLHTRLISSCLLSSLAFLRLVHSCFLIFECYFQINVIYNYI